MSSKLFLFSAVVVSGIAVPALADLTHTFDSYHAFCVYGGGSGMQWWQSDAAAMAGRFGAAGYDAHLYGPGQSTGNLSDALTDMVSLSQARPNELIVFYYSGHGNFHDPVTGIGGLLDTNNDESQA